MAISIINNQAIKLRNYGDVFHNDNDGICQNHLEYHQLSECDDTVAFEVGVSEVTGTNVLNDPNFNFTEVVSNGDFASSTGWSFGGNWVYDGVNDLADGQLGINNDILAQNSIVTASNYYQLDIEVKNYSAGNLNSYVGDQVSTQTYTADGVYQEAIQAGAGSNLEIDWRGAPGLTFVGDVDNVSLTRSDYWTFVNNSGNMYFDTGSSVSMFNSDELTQTIMTVGSVYKISGTAVVNGGSMGVYSGTTSIGQITASGNFEFVFVADSTDIKFIGETSADINLSALDLAEISKVGFGLKDESLGTYSYIEYDLTSVTYGGGDTALVSFDWVDVIGDGYDCTESCYQICVFDASSTEILGAINEDTYVTGTELISNGTFNDATGWTLDTTGTITGGHFEFRCAACGVGGKTSYLSLVVAANSGNYRLQYDITNHSGGQGKVYITDVPADPENNILKQTTISGDASITTSVDTSVWGADSLAIALGKNPFTGSVDYDLDNLSLQKYLTLQEALDNGTLDAYLLCSESLNVGTEICTVYISGSNDNNAFGLEFEDLTYTQYLRVKGILRNPKYIEEIEQNISSQGETNTHYFKTTKVWQLFLYQQPEYIHDFMRIWKGMDTKTIDGVSYEVIPGDYEPDWEASNADLASVTIEVKLKTELNESRNC